MKYYISSIVATCLFLCSCSHDNELTDLSIKAADKNAKQEVIFDVSDIQVEIINKSVGAATSMKVLDYRSYLKTVENGVEKLTLQGYKRFKINDQKQLEIRDSLPTGDYLISVIAGTKDTYYNYPLPNHAVNTTGLVPDYETDILATVLSISVNPKNGTSIKQALTLKRLVGRVEVKITDMDIKNLPDSVQYLTLAVQQYNPMAFSFTDLSTVGGTVSSIYGEFDNRFSNSVSRDQIKALNDKGIKEYTFRLNMLENSGHQTELYLIGNTEDTKYYRYVDDNRFYKSIKKNLIVKRNQTTLIPGNVFTK